MASPTPYVRGYQSQVEPNALPSTPSAPVLDDAARASASLSGSLGQASDVVYKYDTDKAVMQAHDQIAQGMMDITQHVNDLKQTTFGKDPTGFTPAVHKVVDDYGLQLVNQTSNPTAKKYLAESFARLGMHTVEQASNWERSQQDRFQANQINDQTKSYTALVAADPTSYEGYKKTLGESIDVANMSPDIRERVREAALNQLRVAAVESYVLNDAPGAYADLSKKLGQKDTKPTLPNPSPTPGSAGDAGGPIADQFGPPAPAGDPWQRIELQRAGRGPLTASRFESTGNVDPELTREIAKQLKKAAESGDASALLALWNERGSQIKDAAARQKDIDLGLDPNTGVPLETGTAAAAPPVQVASSGETATDVGPMPLSPMHQGDSSTATGKAYIDELTTAQAVEYRNRAHAQTLTGVAGARAELERRLQNVEEATKNNQEPGDPIPPSLFDAAYPDKPTADAKRATYQAWLDFGVDRKTVSTMPNNAIPDYVEKIKPTDPNAVDYAAKMQRWGATAAAANHVMEQRAKDGVDAMNKQGMYPTGPLFDEQGKLSATELNRRQQNSMAAQNVFLTRPLVFTNAEAKNIGAVIANAPFRDQATFLGALRKGIPDLVTFRAAIQQIAPDAPAVALAAMRSSYEPGYALAAGFDAPPTNAEAILRGKASLAPSKEQKAVDGVGGNLVMPANDKMQTEFANRVGDAYAGQPGALKNDFQIVRYLYASYAADAGLVVDPQNKEPNPDLLTKAINNATGGLYSVGGHQIIKPYGMPDDVFADRYAKAYHDTLTREGVDPDTHAPSDYPAINKEPGVYYLHAGVDRLRSKLTGEYIQVVVPTDAGEAPHQKTLRDYIPFMSSTPPAAGAPSATKLPARMPGMAAPTLRYPQ